MKTTRATIHSMVSATMFVACFFVGVVRAAEEYDSVVSQVVSEHLLVQHTLILAQNISALPIQEDRAGCMRRILSPEYAQENLRLMPLLFNNCLQCGVSLEGHRERVGEILNRWGYPRRWEGQLVYDYWPKSVSARFEQVKNGHSAGTGNLAMMEMLVNDLQKEEARLSPADRAVIRRHLSLCNGMVYFKAFLLSHEAQDTPASWNYRFAQAALYNQQIIPELLQEKERSRLSPEEKEILQAKTSFLTEDLRIQIASFLSLFPSDADDEKEECEEGESTEQAREDEQSS